MIQATQQQLNEQFLPSPSLQQILRKQQTERDNRVMNKFKLRNQNKGATLNNDFLKITPQLQLEPAISKRDERPLLIRNEGDIENVENERKSTRVRVERKQESKISHSHRIRQQPKPWAQENNNDRVLAPPAEINDKYRKSMRNNKSKMTVMYKERKSSWRLCAVVVLLIVLFGLGLYFMLDGYKFIINLIPEEISNYHFQTQQNIEQSHFNIAFSNQDDKVTTLVNEYIDELLSAPQYRLGLNTFRKGRSVSDSVWRVFENRMERHQNIRLVHVGGDVIGEIRSQL